MGTPTVNGNSVVDVEEFSVGTSLSAGEFDSAPALIPEVHLMDVRGGDFRALAMGVFRGFLLGLNSFFHGDPPGFFLGGMLSMVFGDP